MAAEIERRSEKVRQEPEIAAANMIGELGRLSFSHPRKMFNPDGKIEPVDGVTHRTLFALCFYVDRGVQA